MHSLSKTWWEDYKPNYIFDRQWFDAFAKIDPSFVFLKAGPASAGLGKIGLVLWHEEDGKTILPVGILYHDKDECIFCYHPEYAADRYTKSISFNLPKEQLVHRYSNKKALLPYFDNLVAEGWLGMAQHNAALLVENHTCTIDDVKEFRAQDNADSRFTRLLLFGRGAHGAISVVDVNAPDQLLAAEDKSLQSQSTLGGAYPKMLTVPFEDQFRYAAREEHSTHIFKFSRGPTLQDEYLNTIATKALLPEDTVAEMEFGTLIGRPPQRGLFIKRFDRTPQGGRIHFEEALQIRNAPEYQKVGLPYKDLADISRNLMGEHGARLVFKRILTQFILGNTDGHFKNFAFWQRGGTWKLTPNYDLGPTVGRNSSTLPMLIDPHGDRQELADINGKTLILLGQQFGLDIHTVKSCIEEISERIPDAKRAIMAVNVIADFGEPISDKMKQDFCTNLDGRVARQFGRFAAYYDHLNRKHGTAPPTR